MKVFQVNPVKYCILEIQPSKMTSNANVKWLLTDFARLYQPLSQRLHIDKGSLIYTQDLKVWWEVLIQREQIKFYVIIPDIRDTKHRMKQEILKTWKQANVHEVQSNLPDFDHTDVDITKLTLTNNSILSLNTEDPKYSLLPSLLNTKNYLQDDDLALLQIGMQPEGNGWNTSAINIMDRIKESGVIPRKKGSRITPKEVFNRFALLSGLVAEELMNLIGDFLIPGWEENTEFSESLKTKISEISTCTKKKVKSDGFKTEFRIMAKSSQEERRKSIIRSISSGYDPLEGDNSLEERRVNRKSVPKELNKIRDRKMTVSLNGDVLCSLELSKMIAVPDQKAQIEHYNELKLVSHRGESEVPKEVFDPEGIPFCEYEDTDGEMKNVHFTTKNSNHLCMPRMVIGEPGSGKTTFAINFSLDSFLKGYGVFAIDAADGKMVQRILDKIPPEKRDKVKIIDFLNTDYPIGLGWNEIFYSHNLDITEDLVVEEVISYIELVANTDLNMRARQWVENAVKATFTTPDATLQDIENMLNNSDYRSVVIPSIEDPELKKDWEYYHEVLKPEERKTIYEEAFRRLSPVMRKKTLKNFVLQRPKKGEDGYLVDIRKWMDEGCLVLVKANETLGETLQTALVSFLLSKFNLAMVSRENIIDEDDRKPCFLILDEPDHYIKGSERWRNMLTRYRKYRCGLIFMFHGWQQLIETDKNLPKIIRKSGPHYVIFQTDEDNLEQLRSVIEPEFKVRDIVRGMPQWHAIVKIKGYSDKGESLPAFMAKALDDPKRRFDSYNNNDLYKINAEKLGKPKKEVMEEIFQNSVSTPPIVSDIEIEPSGEGVMRIEIDEEEVTQTKKQLERMVEDYIVEQEEKEGEIDMDLIEHMDELIEEMEKDNG